MTRVAVIGCGYWGPNLVRNFHQLGSLAACCDLSAERLKGIERLYPGVRTTQDLQGLLDDPAIDAVVIATPARTHFSLARQALLAGKHVLVEKPLAMSSDEAGELIAAARKAQRALMVGHTFEYNPAVHKMKEYLRDGTLGDLFYVYSTRVNLGRVQQDLNALWSIMPHDISILVYLLDALPEAVSAHGASYVTPGVEDVVFMYLRFPDGVSAHVHGSWLDPGKVRRMTLVGSRKMVIYDDIDNEARLKVYDKGVLKTGADIHGEFQLRLHSGDIYIPQISMAEPLRNECAHFLECIDGNKTPVSDGESGLRVIRVLEAAQCSLENNGQMTEVAG
ncbi:MAG: Gfo/Idh/MocA family oxidoreductase [Chloroflexi bacterium]|nr:Gfo/Idh/MocA family oxidoreductase [Chloroflexota bacterium]